MARASSIISVSIIGDAKKLIGAVGQANTASGGLIGSFAKIGIASIGVAKGFDLINDSLKEADRRGDAIQRLTIQLGALAGPLVDTADNFSKIGASTQDMLELEAVFADFATSAGVSAPEIAKNAEQLSAMATALGLIHDQDPTTIITAIGQAIGGQTRGLKQYGIDLTEASVAQKAMEMTGKANAAALTAQELAAARTALIIAGFTPILNEATLGTGDLEQKQKTLGAQMETLGGSVGMLVEGPLTDLLQVFINIIDDIPRLVEDLTNLGETIVGVAADIIGPLARVADLINFIFQDRGAKFTVTGPGIGTGTGIGTNGTGKGTGIGTDRGTTKAVQREQERNGLQTGMGVP